MKSNALFRMSFPKEVRESTVMYTLKEITLGILLKYVFEVSCYIKLQISFPEKTHTYEKVLSQGVRTDRHQHYKVIICG